MGYRIIATDPHHRESNATNDVMHVEVLLSSVPRVYAGSAHLSPPHALNISAAENKNKLCCNTIVHMFTDGKGIVLIGQNTKIMITSMVRAVGTELLLYFILTVQFASCSTCPLRVNTEIVAAFLIVSKGKTLLVTLTLMLGHGMYYVVVWGLTFAKSGFRTQR